MTISTATIPYLYLEEEMPLAKLRDLLLAHALEAIPKERYYYNYRDAIRIIDFVQTKGIYDGWVLLISEEVLPKADQLLVAYPDKFFLYTTIERQFLEGLSTDLLQQALGSQHAVQERLSLIQAVLEERGITVTSEEITAAKEAIQGRNEAGQPQLIYAKVFIWTILVLIILGYLWLIGAFT
ncbi:MAG: hypothetical protein ACRBFS_08700 [Aureispira sp.]